MPSIALAAISVLCLIIIAKFSIDAENKIEKNVLTVLRGRSLFYSIIGIVGGWAVGYWAITNLIPRPPSDGSGDLLALLALVCLGPAGWFLGRLVFWRKFSMDVDVARARRELLEGHVDHSPIDTEQPTSRGPNQSPSLDQQRVVKLDPRQPDN